MKEMTLNEAVALCHDYGQPLSISVNGNEKLYLMDEKAYNRYEEAVIYYDVMQGIEELNAGERIDGEKVFNEINKKYEI